MITLSCRTIRRAWRRVSPTARIIPSSRVRSNTESTSVFTIPNRLTITDSAKSTYRNWSSWSTPCARFDTHASRVRIFTSGKPDSARFSAAVVESDAPPRTFTNAKRSFGRGKPESKASREIMIPPKSGSICPGSKIACTPKVSRFPDGGRTLKRSPSWRWFRSAKFLVTSAPCACGGTCGPCFHLKWYARAKAGPIPATSTVEPKIRALSVRAAAASVTPGARASASPASDGKGSNPFPAVAT